MKEVKIKEITNNLDNKRIPLNSTQRAEKESNPIYPYIGANNIMAYIDEYIFNEKILCVAEDGGSWGFNQTCAKIYNEKVWVNNHAHVLTAKENLILEYLMYYMNYSDLSLHINGATRGKLTKTSLNQIKIPLPPLPQQKKIAAILDAADAYRQKTKALIGKYEELSQSLFLDMFGDSWLNPKRIAQMNLLDVCDQIIDCPHSTPNYVKDISEYPCIRTTELVNGTINWSKMKYLDFDGYIIRTKRLKPEEGDIIYGREGTYGEAVIVPPKVKVSLGQRVMLFRPNYSMVNSLYLHAVLRSKGVYHQALRVNTGSTVGRVNVKDIKRFKLMIPPITLQNQFATRIQAIEAQKAQAQASLAQADDLFNSLLQKAFKGGLGNKI